MQRFLIVIFAVLTLGFAHNANANPRDDRSRRTPSEELKVISLTISPLHFLDGSGELTGEIKALDILGIGFIAGAGKGHGLVWWDAGVTARFYPLGHFWRGLQVGAEIRYVGTGSEFMQGDHRVVLGPFVGGKYIFPVGFTIEGQVGGTFSTKGNVGLNTGDYGTPDVLLNFNVGWSF